MYMCIDMYICTYIYIQIVLMWEDASCRPFNRQSHSFLIHCNVHLLIYVYIYIYDMHIDIYKKCPCESVLHVESFNGQWHAFLIHFSTRTSCTLPRVCSRTSRSSSMASRKSCMLVCICVCLCVWEREIERKERSHSSLKAFAWHARWYVYMSVCLSVRDGERREIK